jgi:hypothetical protein
MMSERRQEKGHPARGSAAPGVPVTQVEDVGLVTDMGVIPVTAEGHALGQARDPGQTGDRG